MSHHHQPQQRVPRSTTMAAVAGVGLVLLGVVMSLWQRHGESGPVPGAAVGNAPIGGGVMSGLQQAAPTLAGILLVVVAVTFVLLYKSRRHQD